MRPSVSCKREDRRTVKSPFFSRVRAESRWRRSKLSVDSEPVSPPFLLPARWRIRDRARGGEAERKDSALIGFPFGNGSFQQACTRGVWPAKGNRRSRGPRYRGPRRGLL